MITYKNNYGLRRKLKICDTCGELQYHYNKSKQCKQCNYYDKLNYKEKQIHDLRTFT